MKRLLVILFVLSLVGCASSVPVVAKFPAAPTDLLEACPDLKIVDPTTTKLSTVIGVVSTNYGQYHQCRLKVDNWIKWYNTQQQIFNNVN